MPSSVEANWITSDKVNSRIDAEYYQSFYQEAEAKVLAGRHRAFGTLWSEANRIYIGIKGYDTVENTTEFTPYLRPKDIGPNGEIDFNSLGWCEKSWLKDHQKKGTAKPGDLIVEVKGNTQKVAVLGDKVPENCIVSGSAWRIQISQKADKHFIQAYLLSDTGQLLKKRLVSNSVIVWIDPASFKEMKIPFPAPEIQTYIGDKIRLAERCREEAQQSWKKAREILEGVLNFKLDASTFETRDKLSVSTERYVVENFAPAIFRVSPSLVDHQIGAKYFHPRRARAVTLLQKSGLILKTLSTVAERKSNRISARVAQDKGLPFIGLANIDQQTGVIDTSADEDEKISGSSALFRQRNILFSKLRPYLNKVTICPEHFLQAYGSTELLVYETRPQYDPYYIYYIVKCPLTLYQVLDITSGATHPRVDPENVDEVLIPICDNDTQQRIANLTRECLLLLYRARDLVVEAKSDVEKLIEGKLDTAGIMTGRVKVPTWEDIQAAFEEKV